MMSAYGFFPEFSDDVTICLDDQADHQFPPLFEDLHYLSFPSDGSFLDVSVEADPVQLPSIEHSLPISPHSPPSPCSSSGSASPSLFHGSPMSQDDELASRCDSSSPPQRKRARVPPRSSAPASGEQQTVVTISREKILEWSCAQLDAFVEQKRVEIARDFTPEEVKEIKRQRRLIKNRESALASRLRKKAELDQLSNEVNQRLRILQEKDARIAHLEKENDQLRHEVGLLRALVGERPIDGHSDAISRTLSQTFTSIGQQARGLFSVDGRNDRRKPSSNSLYLMAILFSFAFFIGLPAMHSKTSTPLFQHTNPSWVLPGTFSEDPLLEFSSFPRPDAAKLSSDSSLLQPPDFATGSRKFLSLAVDLPDLTLDQTTRNASSASSSSSAFPQPSDEFDLSAYPQTRFLCNNRTQVGSGIPHQDSQFKISLMVPQHIIRSHLHARPDSFFEVSCSLIPDEAL